MNNLLFLTCMIFAARAQTAASIEHFPTRRWEDVPRQCIEPPDPGPCLELFLRYYFNYESGKCEKFFYGGCDGNRNNFKNTKECEAECKVGIGSHDSVPCRKENCKYFPEKGNCTAAKHRYFYNGEKCETFIFGGCGLYPNNFETKEECMDSCGISSENEERFVYESEFPNSWKASTGIKDICQHPRKEGHCNRRIRRFYFNGGKCEGFVYSGCGGNPNNFETEKECRDRCGIESETEDYGLDVSDVWWTSMEVVDDCKHPPDKGRCTRMSIRYYFNGQKCEKFIYGGCEGNPNNFLKKKDCMEKCGVDSGNEDDEDYWDDSGIRIEGLDDCEHPAVTGNCGERLYNYYFDGEKCQIYIFGGCEGSPNNFKSKEECMERCGPKSENGEVAVEHRDDEESTIEDKDTCRYLPDKGDCIGLYHRYYFNGETCRTFVYGGYGGNLNNFGDKYDCMKTCVPGYKDFMDVYKELMGIQETFIGNKDDCYHPLDPGACTTRLRRYYFNGRKCEMFAYGGSGGNSNNFETQNDCMKKCGPKNEGRIRFVDE